VRRIDVQIIDRPAPMGSVVQQTIRTWRSSLRLCVRRRIGQTGCDDRVRAGDSTQVRTPDRALRVHRFVRILGCVTIDVKHLCQDFSSPVKKVRHIHQAEYINQQKVTMLIRFQTNAISLELNRLPKGPFWRREISKSSQSTRGNPTIGQNHSACQTHWRKPTDLRGRKLEFEPGGLYGFSKSMSSTPKLANVGDDRGRVVDLTQVKNGRPSPSRPSLGHRPFYWVSVLDQSSEIPVNRFRSLGFPFLDQPNLCNRKRTTHAVRSMYNE
jgi:hypothetical protein